MKAEDRPALMKVRTGLVSAKEDAETARTALLRQCEELEDPTTWECREAVRVRKAMRTAEHGLRNRIDEASRAIEFIDDEIRRAT